jgi:hypothetical protein
MKRFHSLIALLASLVAYASAVSAAEEAEAPEILKVAMKLEGRWQADATLSMGDQKHSFVYFMDFRRTAAGSGLTMEEHGDVAQVGMLRGANLIGFDPYDGRLHWFSVDNFGTTHDHIGQLIGPAHLRLTHESEREGKPFREEIDFVWLAGDRIDAKLVATLNGEVVETLQGRFMRKGR